MSLLFSRTAVGPPAQLMDWEYRPAKSVKGQTWMVSAGLFYGTAGSARWRAYYLQQYSRSRRRAYSWAMRERVALAGRDVVA